MRILSNEQRYNTEIGSSSNEMQNIEKNYAHFSWCEQLKNAN